jgi:hypothetical protein
MSHYTVCHYEKCYGPPVSYSTHIERKKSDGTEHVPYNIKRRDLTRHNKDFIKEAREIGRSAAIEKRLDAVRHQKDADGNEYESKIRKGQICCIEIRMSASVEGMAEIIEQGRLMEWCRESIKWAQIEHGECGSAHGRGDTASSCVACSCCVRREQEAEDYKKESRQG